jgi:protein gp37
MYDVRARLFRLIDATPNLDWILLTKRPENVRDMWPKNGFPDAGVPGTLCKHKYFPNVWLLASISDQATAESMVPRLLECRKLCPVLGVSAEPLLGPIKLCDLRRDTEDGEAFDWLSGGQLNWVIIGGESGADARCCDIEWIRDLVGLCKRARVPAFVKQLGCRPLTTLPDGERWPGHNWPGSPVQFSGDGFGNFSVLGLTDRKGGDPTEWPVDVRVRQFPEVRNA